MRDCHATKQIAGRPHSLSKFRAHQSPASLHFFFMTCACALLHTRPDSIISPHPSFGLVSGFVQSRLARATLWFRVPLIEGEAVAQWQSTGRKTPEVAGSIPVSFK